MLYAVYQGLDDLIAPFRLGALQNLALMPRDGGPFGSLLRSNAAMMEMLSRFRLSHTRPSFDIHTVRVQNRDVPVTEEVVLDMPFGRLLRFARDVDTVQPKVLITAPLSGHFATLLAGTVRTMLRDHDVYVTDWKNARDVPETDGKFGVDEYIAYLIRFMEEIGPGGHILGVCQPCVQALAAVAVMSEDNNPATPRSMTLMAGPVDVRESPTAVNQLAHDKPIEWFEKNVISRVPPRYAGAGRRVYPGFVQLGAFLSMNMDRHRDQHQKMYDALAEGDHDTANRIKSFYDEYFAVLDMTEEFYIETIDRVFQRAELATGEFTFRGRKVRPETIRKTALLTVEGGRDDICGLGQTSAAHDLCSTLRPHLKRHHLQSNVGHYGVFNGRKWENEIYPVVRNMILAME